MSKYLHQMCNNEVTSRSSSAAPIAYMSSMQDLNVFTVAAAKLRRLRYSTTVEYVEPVYERPNVLPKSFSLLSRMQIDLAFSFQSDSGHLVSVLAC